MQNGSCVVTIVRFWVDETSLPLLDHRQGLSPHPLPATATICSDRIDHDLDHPDASLPLRDAVQDLYGTDPNRGDMR